MKQQGRRPSNGERPLPHDREVEAALVASVLADEAVLPEVMATVRPEDIYTQEHRYIYEACLALAERQEAINEVTVAYELGRRGLLDAVGGISYLSQLVAQLPTPTVAAHYAQIVARDAAYRRLIQVAYDLARTAYRADNPDVAQVIAEAQKQLHGVLEAYAGRDVARPVGATLAEDDGPVQWAVETPHDLRSLRDYITGIVRGEVMVVGADTGVGKSAMGILWAVRAAQAGRRVLYLSAEMPQRDIDRRALALLSGISYRRLREGGELDMDDLAARDEARGVLEKLPLHVIEVGRVDVDWLRAACYRHQMRHGLDLLVVDHLHLLSSGERHRSDVEEVTAISHKIKALAMDLPVAVMSLAQLRRRATDEKAPTLWDLRQSGAIEQDADYVLLLHWARREKEAEEMSAERTVEVYVAKNRHGPLTRPSAPLRYRFLAATGEWVDAQDGRKRVTEEVL